MNLSICMTLVDRMNPADVDSILARVSAYSDAGVNVADAQRMAAYDHLAEIDAEGAEIRRLVREQHPDLFVVATAPPAPAPVKPRVFSRTNPDIRMARRITRGVETADDAMVPETPEFLANNTGDLAVMPAGLRGVENLPIRLMYGQDLGDHRGFGMTHMVDNATRYGRSRMPPPQTGDLEEDLVRQVVSIARNGTEVYDDGPRIILRDTRSKEAIVLQPRGRYYSVVTLKPSAMAPRSGFIGKVRTTIPAAQVAAGARRDNQVGVKPPSPVVSYRPRRVLALARDANVWYHGTTSDVDKFSRIDGGNMWGRGVYLSDDPETASGYALGTAGNRIAPQGNAGPNVMPLRVAPGELFDMKATLTPATLKRIEKAIGEKLKDYTWPGMKNRDLRQVLFEQFTNQEGANAAIKKAGFIGIVEAETIAGKGRTLMAFDPKDVSSDISSLSQARDMEPGPTYMSRPVANASDLHAWAVAQGFTNIVPPEKMHVTQAYSKAPIDASKLSDAPSSVIATGGDRKLAVMGTDEKVLAIRFESPDLQSRWQETMDAGASWDHGHSPGSYNPHVTISYEDQPTPAGIKPYAGPIVLGPETAEPLQTGWSASQGLSSAPVTGSLASDIEAQAAWLNEKSAAAGYDSLDDMIDSDFDAFMKLAEELRDQHRMEIALARSPSIQATLPGQFTLPEFGAASLTIEALQDRYNRWKQAIDAVTAQDGIITEANDFYRAEERYHGKVASRIEDLDQEVQNFIEAVAKDGMTTKDVELYAYAKHAKERNEAIRARRAAGATGFDSWSGMTDEEADEILQAAKDEGLDTKLDKHHATLMKWTQGTRDLLLDEGLITGDQYLVLNASYDNYIPLKGNASTTGAARGTGSGFNIRGKETERARGRYSMAEDIIEQILQDRIKTLIRAGKNEVLRTFLQFVVENPSDNLWKINAVQMKPVVTTDENGNQVIEEEPQVIKGDRTVGVKDGGREVSILIKDEKLLEQMRNMNVESMSKAIGALLATQRMLGRMYTSLNPVFTVLNWARDTQTATMGMLDEVGFKGAARLWSSLPSAMKESWNAEFGTPSAEYQLFRSTGGKTGFMNFKDIPDMAKDLSNRLAKAEMASWDPRVWAPATLDLVEKINAVVENSTRFAGFQAARAEGKTVGQASSISKNLTVNFNRRGTWTPQLSAFFLFFNPAVQGTARVAQSLRSPKVLATLGAAMGGVAMLALQNASMGDDDDGVAWWDKIPQDIKDRNLVIVWRATESDKDPAGEAIPGTRGGRYSKIPMPYGWNWFATIANQAVDMWRNRIDPARGVTPQTAIGNVFKSFLKAYMPVNTIGESLDNTKSLALTGFPGIAQPVVQSVLNTNAFGRKMYPEDSHNESMPDSSKYFAAQSGTIFQKAAEKLNAVSGGTKYKSGFLDFTPATIETFVRSYGGGPASFALDLANMMYARQSIERPDLDVRRAPFVKQLYGRIDAETDRASGYDKIDKISAVADRISAAKKDGRMDEARAIFDADPAIASLGEKLKTVRQNMSSIRKKELSIIAGDQTDAAKYASMQELDLQKRQVLQAMNRAYNAAVRESAPPGK